MSLSQLTGALVFDHDTLPLRVVLEPTGLQVYVNDAKGLFLAAADVVALATAATSFYAPPPVPVTPVTP